MSTCYGVKCDKLRELQWRRRLAARRDPAPLRHQDAQPALRACRTRDSAPPPPPVPGTLRPGDPGDLESAKAPPRLVVPFPRRPGGSSAARCGHHAPVAVGRLWHKPGTPCPRPAAPGSRSILRPRSPPRGPGRLPARSPGRGPLQPESPKVARPRCRRRRLGQHALLGSPPPAPPPTGARLT